MYTVQSVEELKASGHRAYTEERLWASHTSMDRQHIGERERREERERERERGLGPPLSPRPCCLSLSADRPKRPNIVYVVHLLQGEKKREKPERKGK